MEESPKNLSPLWFHCSSGEFEYAKAVIREIKSLNKDTLYWSPTFLQPILNKLKKMKTLITSSLYRLIFQVRFLALSNTSIPELFTFHVRICGRNSFFNVEGITFPLIYFPLPAVKNSVAFGVYKKLLLNQLDQIFAVSLEDKTNLIQSGVVPAIEVIGDTRFAQAIYIEETTLNLKTHFDGSPIDLTHTHCWIYMARRRKILLPAVLELLVEKKKCDSF